MVKYSATLETIVAIIILIVIALFAGRLKYYQYLEEQYQQERRQEK